jgi:hypothetical protein
MHLVCGAEAAAISFGKNMTVYEEHLELLHAAYPGKAIREASRPPVASIPLKRLPGCVIDLCQGIHQPFRRGPHLKTDASFSALGYEHSPSRAGNPAVERYRHVKVTSEDYIHQPFGSSAAGTD